MNRIDTLLYEELSNEFEALNEMEVGTETYKTTVDGMTKLLDRAIEMEKVVNDREERVKERENETELKLKQIEEDRKDRKWKNGIAIGTAASGVLLTVWGTLKTFAFEKEDSVTTIMGRGFFSNLLPKRK